MNLTELDELIELYGKSIYSFCLNLTKQKSDADDLYQETFLKAVEYIEKIEKDKNPKAYLTSLAIGIYKNNRKKYAVRQRIAPMEQLEKESVEALVLEEQTPEEQVISNELKQKIRNASGTLLDKFRIPLYMYYTLQMSVDEISAALKIPKGTVKSRLYKARKSMKEILEGSDYEIF